MENIRTESIGISRKKKVIVAAVVTFGLVLCGVAANMMYLLHGVW